MRSLTTPAAVQRRGSKNCTSRWRVMEVHDCDPRPRRAIACTRGARWVYQMPRQHLTKVRSGCPHRAGRMRATCRRHVNPARRLPGLTCTSQQNESRRRPIARRSVHRAHRQATAMIAEARGAQKGAATRRRGGATDASGQARGSTQKIRRVHENAIRQRVQHMRAPVRAM